MLGKVLIPAARRSSGFWNQYLGVLWVLVGHDWEAIITYIDAKIPILASFFGRGQFYTITTESLKSK